MPEVGGQIVSQADDGRPLLAEHGRSSQRTITTKERHEMAYAGKVIENPVSGEKITFHKTAADTDGELLEITLELSPTAPSPAFTFIRARPSGSRSCPGR